MCDCFKRDSGTKNRYYFDARKRVQILELYRDDHTNGIVSIILPVGEKRTQSPGGTSCQ